MRGPHNGISPHRVGLVLLVLHMFVSSAWTQPTPYAFTCPTGWTLGYGKCYKFFEGPHTFDDAQDICSNFGGGNIAIGHDNHVKASFIRYVVENSYPTSDVWWQGASLPAGENPESAPVVLVTGETINSRVGFFDNWEIKPGAKPYRRCLAMMSNQHSYLYPVVYGSGLRPCRDKLPFVCVQECCPAGHPNYPNSGGMLKCVNGRCVPRFRACDGVDDCGDKTDERDCNTVVGVNSNLYTGTTSGVFSLQGYGSYNYYKWSVEVDPGYHISANISNLSIEKDSDILEVWCGGRSLEKSALLWRHSGVETFIGPLRCLAPFMTFIFYSDYDVNLNGFSVAWAAAPQPPIQILYASDEFYGSILLDKVPGGSRKVWTIATTNKWLIVTIKRIRLNLPPGSFLTAYDGEDFESPEIFTYYAGDEDREDWLSGAYLQSTGQYMTLYLWTPVDAPYGVLEFTYYAGCHVELVATRAYIQNAGRWDNIPYPNNVECTYSVTTNSTLLDDTPGQYELLEIVIENVDVESLDNLIVWSDDLVVFDSTAPVPPFPIRLPALTQTVHVTFTTSARVNDRGFLIALSTGCPDLTFDPVTTIASPLNPTFGLGVVLTVECRPGYFLAQDSYSPSGPYSGPIVLTCGAGGWIWSPQGAPPGSQVVASQRPVCEKRRCGPPPVIPNTFVPDQINDPNDGFGFGDTVRYTCLTGFGFALDDSLDCDLDGSGGVDWIGALPVCTGTTTCPSLPLVIANGDVTILHGPTANELYATLEYTCVDGFEIDGSPDDTSHSKYRVCVSGNWEPADTPPTCRRLTCWLPDIRNAVPFAQRDIATGSTVAVTCRPGYTLTGSSTIECELDQTLTYSTTIPTCTDIDECANNGCTGVAVGPGLNPSFNCQNIPGSYKCWCSPGFELDGSLTNCVDKLDCTGSGGLGPCQQACAETVGSYECSCPNVGFELYPFEGFGGWNNPPGDDAAAVLATYRIGHSCVRVPCAFNNAGSNRIVLRGGPYHFGDTISFYCPLNTTPSRVNTVSTCDATGNWNPALITCEAATCTVPDTNVAVTQPIYRNAGGTVVAVGSTVPAGTTLTLTCSTAPGRPFQTTLTRTCRYDSTNQDYRFDGDHPHECAFVECPPPEGLIPSATFTYDATSPSPPLSAGARYFIICTGDAQFSGNTGPVGSTTGNLLTCSNTGEFNLGTATCTAGQCSNPLSIPGSTQITNNYQVGSTVTYTCNQAGYELVFTPSGAPSPVEFTCMAGSPSPFWSPAPSVYTTLECADTTPPTITCPPDRSVPINSVVNLLPPPTGSDNSGFFSYSAGFLGLNEDWTDGSPLVNPPLQVTYIGQGLDLNSPTDSCSYTISALDQTPPDISCPPSFTYYATVSGASVTVSSIIPSNFVFTTDTEAQSNVVFSINSVSHVLGTPNAQVVIVTATDAAGNSNTCRFTILVKDHCSLFDLPAPVNGVRSCSGIPRTCVLSCTSPFTFIRGNNLATSYTYTCNVGTGVWEAPFPAFLPDGITPQCSAPVSGNALRQFRWIYPINTAGVTTMITCVDNEYKDEFIANAVATAADFNCGQFGVTPTIETTSVVASTDAPANTELYMDFDVRMDTPNLGVGSAAAIAAIDSCVTEITSRVQTPNTFQAVSALGDQPDCHFIFMARAASAQNPFTTRIDCSAGTISNGGIPIMCVPCGAGTFFDSTANGCVACPQNTYSDTMGATLCLDCPNGGGTRGIGSTSNDCEATCSQLAGSGTNQLFGVSSTGVQPCAQCPINMYVDPAFPNTGCISCPTATGSITPGAATAASCIAVCAAGSVSPTGLGPSCGLCPQGSYQNNPRQMSCISCPSTTQSTLGAGSALLSQCLSSAAEPNICSVITCVNGGCDISGNLPKCTCAAGFTGINCDTIIDQCRGNPCGVGGTCTNAVNSFTCTSCPSGYSGTTCQQNNNCAGNPCQNGECQTVDYSLSNINGYTCVCLPGFQGTGCSPITTSICAIDPCVNGPCTNYLPIRRLCSCNPGWTGADCDVSIDDCASAPCRNGGDCVDGTNSFSCTCNGPWAGTYCSDFTECTVAGQCNSGVCIPDYRNAQSYCRCDEEDNWFPTTNPVAGESSLSATCQFIQPCSQSGANNCQNGGSCVNLPGTEARCEICNAGWEGNMCQTSIDDCATNPCVQGTCVDQHQGYLCECIPGWEGINCQINTNECAAPADCDPVGTATIDDGVCYCECICRTGYTGSRCETDINDCGPDTCRFDATCDDRINSFSCNCPAGRFGTFCENSLEPCTVDECNTGECRPGGYCSCPSDTSGSTCNNVVNICDDVSDPCLTGTCTPLPLISDNAFTCSCPPDRAGEYCQTAVSACDNIVCLNGGTCEPGFDSFTCRCPQGFTGPLCGVGSNSCPTSYCANQGTCVMTVTDPLCCCIPGYGGARCEKLNDYNFDLHCDGSRGVIYQMNPFKLLSDSFTIAVWVRYIPDITPDDGVDDATGVILTFYAASGPYNIENDLFGDKEPLLILDESAVRRPAPLSSASTHPYIQPNNEIYEINDGQWYRLVVTCDGTTGQLNAYINTVKVVAAVVTKVGYLEYAWMTLGSGFNNVAGTFEDSTKGGFSQVFVWNEALSEENVIAISAPPSNPPGALFLASVAMDYSRWVFHPGCWLDTPTQAGSPYIPLPPEQPFPRFTNCPDEPITAIGTERRTVVVWDELQAENSATSIWCRHKSGRAFTWGLYTNVCIIKNAPGFTATCKFDIVVRKLNCPDPIIYNGELPPNCYWLNLYGGVRICEPMCPASPDLTVSVAQPLSYMCDKLGSFNPQYIYNEGRIPACGVEADYEVLYNVVVQASYPNVSLCESVSLVNGISEELRVIIRDLNDMSHSLDPDGGLNDSPLCMESDCSDVIMKVDCPGTHITIELHYTQPEITYTPLTPGPTITFPNARELMQQLFIDNDLFDSTKVLNGDADPYSLCFDLYPVCLPGAGYLKGRCVECAKGQYAPKNDEPCRMCPAGSYQDEPGSINCTACPPGKTTEFWGAVSVSECIWTCNPGEYYNVDTRACEYCPIGTYSEDSGMTRCCHPCQAYQTTLYPGADSEDKCVDTCPDGHMLLYDDHCVPCERGYYRQQDLQDDCQPCPAGFTTEYSASVYLTDCSFPDCSPGTYVDGQGCTPCPLGYYQPATSQLECIKCPQDKTTLILGSTKEKQCIFACPPGKEPINGIKCKPCEIGYYKDSNLPDEFCKKCPDDFITQTTGAISIAKCIVPGCEPGYYLANNLCAPCPVDTYQPDYWQTFCQACPPGTSTSSQLGSDSESDCKRYCPAGQDDQGGICLPCPLGTWKGAGSHAPCTNCTDRLWTAGTGSTSEAQCDRQHCYPGEFLTTELDCEDCERGYYQPDFQQSWCLPCYNGLTTIGTGNSDSSDCILDCYSGQGWNAEVESCVLCPQGTYRTQGEQDLCTPCTRGYTTPADGSYSAADCSQVACFAGYYLVVDLNACKECPIGTYQPKNYQLSCKHCPEGTTTTHPASTNHTDCKRKCPAGYETDTYYNCKPCARGYYRGEYDGFDCIRCPGGSTTLHEGATSKDKCTLGDCRPGHYQNGQVCRPCPYGTYQPHKWQPSCIPCDKYWTTPTTGSTSNHNCTVKASCNSTCISHELGGVCEATDYGHVCACRPGWTGYHPSCIPLCSTRYCTNYEDCYTDDQGQPECRCRPGWDSKCKEDDQDPNLPTDLAILIGAPVAGGVIFILLVCIAMFACGCCSCNTLGRPYHRHKGSPTPSVHSSTYGNTLFQHPAVRYANQHVNQHPYNNPTSAGNEPTVIHIQTTPSNPQPAPPAAPTQAPAYSIDYGYSNPNLNSRFKFFEDSSATKANNIYQDPTVATMNFN